MKLDFLILMDNLLAENQSVNFPSSLFIVIDKDYIFFLEKKVVVSSASNNTSKAFKTLQRL